MRENIPQQTGDHAQNALEIPFPQWRVASVLIVQVALWQSWINLDVMMLLSVTEIMVARIILNVIMLKRMRPVVIPIPVLTVSASQALL